MQLLRLYILFLIISVLSVSAGAVTIKGRALQWAGHNIELKTYSDYITRNTKSLGYIQIDENGNFMTEVDVKDVTYAFADLGHYKAFIYLQPGNNVDVVLPAYKPRPDKDRFNPFYEQELVELGIKSGDTKLNNAIKNFDKFFNYYYNKNVVRLARGRDTKLAQKLIARCDSFMLAQKCGDKYFKNYVKFREALIYSSPRMGDVRGIMKQYFDCEAVYNVPSYYDALQMICPNFVTSNSVYTKMKDRPVNLSRMSYRQMSQSIKRDSVYGRASLRENLILMGIYDAHYGKLMNQKHIDTLLCQAAHEACTEDLKEIARNIIDKINYLRPLTQAPDFNITSLKNRELSLKRLKGKFVYLCFLNTQSPASKKAFAALDAMQRKYQQDITVVGVLTDLDPDVMKKNMKNYKPTWTAARLTGDESMLLDYQVKAMPQYFLIDPNGRIAAADVPAPHEGVEKVVASELQRYKKEQLRNKAKQKKTFYDLYY